MQNHSYKSLILGTLILLGVENLSGQALFTNDSMVVTNESGMTITVQGAITNKNSATLTNKGFIQLTGNWTNSAVFDADSGLVEFNGTTLQTISGDNTFYNLAINNTSGVTVSSGVQKIIMEIGIDNGTFDVSADSLILISDSNNTARISEIAGTGSITGDITMQRYLDTGVTGWHFISAAVSGATVSDWDDDMVLSIPDGINGVACCPTFYSVQSYDESVSGTSDNGFTDIATVATTIATGVGYWVYTGTSLGFTDPFTFDVTGPANTFSTSLPVSYTSSGLSDDDGWNMVGNPYPSPIDWDAAGWTKTNIDDAVYIYNADSGFYASYVSGAGANGGSENIGSSQAFWVKANASSPVLTVTEPVKTSIDTSWLKMNTSIPNLFRLRVNGGGYGSEVVIRFLSAATDGFDSEYDAYYIGSSNSPTPQISTAIDPAYDLTINSMPELVTDMEIPVRVIVKNSGNYTIRASNFNDMPTTSCILLEDKMTGIFTNLRTTSTYSFTMSNTTQIPRFALHVGAPVSSESIGAVCKGDNNGLAVAKGSGSGPWDYFWEDLSGTVIQSNFSVPGSDTIVGVPAGMYIFTVTDVNGYCATRTDTVNVGEPASSLAPNTSGTDLSCFNSGNGIAGINANGGIPPYTYNWSTGDTIASIVNLATGSYSATVTDANGCIRNDLVIIDEPAILSSQYQKTDVACFGDNSGQINLSVIGGTAPYTYTWSSGDSIEAVVGLTSGLYTVAVEDANGCLIAPEDITINDGIQLTAGYTAPPISYLSDKAEVQFTSISSNATSFLWDFADGSTSVDQNPLHVYNLTGSYSVVLTVYNGACIDSHSDIITILESPTGLGPDSEPFDQITFTKEQGDVTVKFNFKTKSTVRIEVVNGTGQLIMNTSQAVSQTDIKLGLVDLAFGIYLVNVSTDSMTITRKFVLGE